jgi:hypothetical protein
MITAQKPGYGLWDSLSSSVFQSVLGVLIVLAVCWLAFYVMSRLRDSNTLDVPLEELVRNNFEEMRSGGDISDAEFRNITSLLEARPRRSTSSSDIPPSDPTADDVERKLN